MKPVIITLGNNKGGVGKTTSCVNLAAAIALAGRKVLVVDGDPQSNTTSSLLPDMSLRERRNLVAALEEEAGTFSAHACETTIAGLSLVPNSIQCMEWEIKSHSGLDSVFGFKRLVQNDRGLGGYDYLIIDTPPNIGPMLRNALLVSHYVLVPCPVGDQYALDGFATFLKVLSQAQAQNPDLRLLGALLTKYDRRSGTHKRNRISIRKYFDSKGIPIFDTDIRVNIDLDRAHSRRESIFQSFPAKPGAQDYQRLGKEVLARVEE